MQVLYVVCAAIIPVVCGYVVGYEKGFKSAKKKPDNSSKDPTS